MTQSRGSADKLKEPQDVNSTKLVADTAPAHHWKVKVMSSNGICNHHTYVALLYQLDMLQTPFLLWKRKHLRRQICLWRCYKRDSPLPDQKACMPFPFFLRGLRPISLWGRSPMQATWAFCLTAGMALTGTDCLACEQQLYLLFKQMKTTNSSDISKLNF